jgi:hypothetical protein
MTDIAPLLALGALLVECAHRAVEHHNAVVIRERIRERLATTRPTMSQALLLQNLDIADAQNKIARTSESGQTAV